MRITVLVARLVLGGVFGVFLWRVFFPRSGVHVAAILGAGMVALAYIIEKMRVKRTSREDKPAPRV